MEEIAIKILDMVNNSKQFSVLNSQLKIFNPFKVLRIEEFEIRHSNFLGWLINPNENHQTNDFFLRHLLVDFVKQIKDSDTFSFQDLFTSSLKNTTVLREYKLANKKSIDLLIICEDISTVIIIENKIKSSEHSNQLQDYLQFVINKYKGYKIIPVFLTLFGDEPSCDEYISYEYESILDKIQMLLISYENSIPKEQFDFIKHYYSALQGVLKMGNEKSIELAKTVYSEYKDVIDFITNNVNTNYFISACHNFITKNGFTYEASTGNAVYFHSKELKKLSGINIQKWKSELPISFWFRRNGDIKIGLVIEIGPVIDNEFRVVLLEKFKKNGFKFQQNAYQSGTKYTRVYSVNKEFDDWDEEELIESFLDNLFFKIAQHEIDKTYKIIEEVIKEKSSNN